MPVESRSCAWDAPTMRAIDETRIDEKCRTSALTGLAKPGERYKVIKASEREIRLLRMEVEQPKLPRRSQRTFQEGWR